MARPNYIAMLLGTFKQFALSERYEKQLAPYEQAARMGRMSQDMARLLLFQLQPVLDELRDFPVLLHRPPKIDQWNAAGKPDIDFGSLVEAPDIRFGMQFRGAQHAGFVGQTDSGKTVAIRNLIFKIHEWNEAHPDAVVSILAFDPKGGDFADIPGLLGRRWRHFSATEGLRVGTNGPRGVPPAVWIGNFSLWFAARAQLQASSICLANSMKFVLPLLNPQPKEDLDWPSLSDLRDIAKRAPLTLFASKPDYERSYIQKLDGIADLDVFATRNGLDLQRDLIDHGLSAVIDTCGLTPPWARLHLTDALLGQLLVGRQYAFRKVDRIDTVVIFEESDDDVSRRSEESFPDGSMSPIARSEKQSREGGVAVMLSISALGAVARQVLTNMPNIYVFRVGDFESILEARKTLLLPSGAEAILPALEKGQCLVRTSNGWPHAVLGQFDNVAPSRVARPASFDGHPFVPRTPLSEYPDLEAAIQRLIAEHRKTSLFRAKNAQEPEATLPENAHKLLHARAIHDYFPVARLWEKAGLRLSPAAQMAACAALQRLKLAAFETSRISKRNSQLMEILEKGYSYLHRSPPRRKGRGGISHTHFCEWIRMVGEKRGYEACTEWIVPGTHHPCDAAWKVGDYWMAFEVVVNCSDNLTAHVKTMAECREIHQITVVASSKALLGKLEKTITSELALSPVLARLSYKPVEDFLKELGL